MHDPKVPMTPETLPQQRLTAVRDLPPRPEGLVFEHEGRPRPRALQRARFPREANFLCQVEWAWSPMHNAIHSHYLCTRRDYWIIWVRWLDDEFWPPRWRWWFQGWARRVKGVDERTAAFHLLADLWREQRDDQGYDHFHWINEEGEFDAADLAAIGRAVWEGGASDD